MTEDSNSARAERAAEINDEVLEQGAGGAGGTGKVSMNDFHFVMRTNAAQPTSQGNQLQKKGSFDIT